MTLSNVPNYAPEQAMAEIRRLFIERGANAYDGEPVTQLAHALQAAQLAERAHADPATVVAALLHDIGHFIPSAHAAGYLGRVDHDWLGAEWLEERGFPDSVTQLVRHHVDAKRYLVAKQPAYMEALSDVSRQTLIWQGGPMTTAEIAAFEEHPFFLPIIQVRRYDEAAKVENLPTPTLDDYIDYTLRFLRRSRGC